MHKTQARIICFCFTVICLAPALGQRMSFGHRFGTNQFTQYKAQFETGDTNAPLLAMDWFAHGDHFCRVSQSGRVFAALDVGYAIEGGHQVSLDTANMFLLRQAINHLPPSSRNSLPRERQIYVCGIRSNQWFQCDYDRADVPREVERLFGITGAYLEWFIPKVEGHVIVHSENGNYRGSQAMINSFAIARDAPIAVSTGVNGLQIWNLDKTSGGAILPLKKTPYHANLWSVATLSPDGKIIVFTGGGSQAKTVYAFDWRRREVLWEIPDAAVGNTYGAGSRLFAVGNLGHSLFIAETKRIERWDLASGTKLATLITNQAGVKFLQTSRNGKMLVAGFGDHSFMVWRTANDEPVAYFTEPEEVVSLAVSPAGRKIALSTYSPGSNLILWNVQTKTQEELPLRIPYASRSAIAMYWSPDGKWLAANVDTYPPSIVIYETAAWKPVARWPCEQVMTAARFGFRNDGVFLELMDHAISGLDLTRSEVGAE